jgi:hypothetical protein
MASPMPLTNAEPDTTPPSRWINPILTYAILAEFDRGNPLAVWPVPLWTDEGEKVLFYNAEQLLGATRLPPRPWVDPTVTRQILATADTPDCWPIILYAHKGTRSVLFHSAEELLAATLPADESIS